MVFCNLQTEIVKRFYVEVTILILIDGFLQFKQAVIKNDKTAVTILILIDGFLQSVLLSNMIYYTICHNPYFNRWFSAI